MSDASLQEYTAALLNGYQVNSGVRFARVNNDKKAEYRQRAADFIGTVPAGVLSLLTFPNVKWEFERAVMSNQIAAWRGKVFVVAVERESNIYRAAIKDIPGRKDKQGFGIKFVERPAYARCAIQTKAVRSFLHCSFEDLAMSQDSPMPHALRYYFNAAWLDFCGPLTVARKIAIESLLLHHSVKPMRLAITFMDGRWPKDATDVWGADRLGGIERWLSGFGDVVFKDRYVTNAVPMAQFHVEVIA